MDVQILLVAMIIFAAAFYVGLQIWRKAKSFSPKNSCGSNCGCDGGGAKIKN